MYVFNIVCAFSWNKKNKLTARMHGVERFTIDVKLSLDLTITVEFSGGLCKPGNGFRKQQEID
jgi:predicted metallopeptidase